MNDLAADLRSIAIEARPVIEQMMDGAEILAGLGKVCREKGIDWAQLKGLLKAQIHDERDESGAGDAVTKILDKADAASAYADLLFRKMNKKNFSSPRDPQSFGNPEQLTNVPGKPADAIKPSPVTVSRPAQKTSTDAHAAVRDDLAIPDDLSIPKAFRRAPQEALS